MEAGIFTALNLPCALLGLLVNAFYVFCLMFPLSDEVNIRQPLRTLLLFMISHTSAFQLSLIFYISLRFTVVIYTTMEHTAESLMFYTVRVSIPTSLWLCIFYCSQIVPARNTALRWIKRNITVIVYFLLIATNMFLAVYLVLEFLAVHYFPSITTSHQLQPQVNGTNGSYTPVSAQQDIGKFLDTLNTLMMVLTLLNLCVMLTATGVTGNYLYHHIKKMTKSGMPFQSQILQNQVRVTITGFVQGLLYFFCSTGLFLEAYCTNRRLTCDQDIVWMLFDLYSLATTFNLGVGQSLFRQRVAHLCQKTGCLLPA